jgi:hypothetical protein
VHLQRNGNLCCSPERANNCLLPVRVGNLWNATLFIGADGNKALLNEEQLAVNSANCSLIRCSSAPAMQRTALVGTKLVALRFSSMTLVIDFLHNLM